MENSEKYPLVSVISVNYNTAQVTIETIKSLQNISYPNIEIIVVDNGSAENPDVIKEECPEINFLKLDQNLGFAGGNNLGIQVSKGEYVLLLNSDTEVEEGFLEPLVQLLQSDQKIGAVSPKLLYFFSENKNVIQFAGSGKINMFTGRGFVIGKNKYDDGSYNQVMETNLMHGAAVLLPKKVIREVGLMPELYFLYYEEVDWAERIKRSGYKIYYHGGSKVYHKESMSVGKENPMKTYYMNRNRILFIRRNAKPLITFVCFLFYTFVSIPKNVLVFLLKGKVQMALKLVSGYLWNYTHLKIKKHPFLNEKDEIIYAKINT